jgi:hypothetical protein
MFAIYSFFWSGRCLKVGKVGDKSHARFTSQHYMPGSSNSNLAKSLLKVKIKLQLPTLSEENVGEWIERHTDRVNVFIPRSFGIPILSLLEVFMQCRLTPMFEGFNSQKEVTHDASGTGIADLATADRGCQAPPDPDV